MSKKLKIMSLSIEPEMHDLLKESAKKAGYSSTSCLIRELVNKYLDLLVQDKDEVPVILRVPSELREDPSALQNWLEVKKQAIVKALVLK